MGPQIRQLGFIHVYQLKSILHSNSFWDVFRMITNQVVSSCIFTIYFIQQMNYIQRAWLVALRPVSQFVNQKLAKKKGLLGRIGRFYAFGPREFGYHPTNKLLAYVNQIVVSNMGFIFHKYSVIKSFTMNGPTYMRTYRVMVLLGYLTFLATAYIYSIPEDYKTQEGTTLKYIKDNLGPVPINALQNRESAHFTEINSYYLQQMAKRLVQKENQIISERNNLSQKERKTRYARDGYEYVEPHSNLKNA